MKSHTCQFGTKDLLRLLGGPLAAVGIFAALMHLGASLNVLPAPRPALDIDRTILIHQAGAARSRSDAGVLLIGDSSCLMDVSARQLGDALARPVLNLGTLSYLDLEAQAGMVLQYAAANPDRLRAVVLLMHPEALRRLGPEPYHVAVLTNFWSGLDHCRGDRLTGRASCLLGLDIIKGRLLARALPVPLGGAYGRYYGFTADLERFMEAEHGSAIDPDSVPARGNAEFRLAPTLEAASRAFKNALPPGVKLIVGITPAPERFAGRAWPQRHGELLRQWAQWLQADAVLGGLPAVLAESSFARTTHLNNAAVPAYTDALATELKRVLP